LIHFYKRTEKAMTMTFSPLTRQVMAGMAGAAGGLLASNLTSKKQDVTYQEPPASSALVQPNLPPRASKILAFGRPKAIVPSPMVYKNHVLDYDSARRVPRWVAEHLTKEQVKQEVANRKGVNFSPDPIVPLQFTSTNKDYWGSGWSRGHMAPAGNNKHCQDSMNDTFYLTNVVPQDLDNNGGYWNRLEIWVRGLTDQYQDVWVVSGPLWLPSQKEIDNDEKNNYDAANDGKVTKTAGDSNESKVMEKGRVKPPRPVKTVSYPVLGPNNVAVPTHLYKVVLVTDPMLDKPLLGTFVVPNIPVGDKHLAEFKVDIEEVEKGVGVTFHPDLDRDSVGDLCIKSGCNLQDFKQFQQFFWTRRLRSPRNMFFLEKDWEEAKKKGVVNPQLEQVYMESKAKLEIRESIVDKNIMNVDKTAVVAPAA